MHTHTLHVCCVAACCTATTAPAAVFTYTFVTVYTRRGGVLLCHTLDHVCVCVCVCVWVTRRRLLRWSTGLGREALQGRASCHRVASCHQLQRVGSGGI